jgi:hypothetical protein
VVSYLPDNANATLEEDDSEELPPIPAAEAQRMIQSLETFWLKQSDTEDHFMTTLQRMRDKVRAIWTRQRVQQGNSELFYTSLGNTDVGNIIKNRGIYSNGTNLKINYKNSTSTMPTWKVA